MNFQKTALFVFCKCIVLGARLIGGRGFLGFVLIAIAKNGHFIYVLSIPGPYKGD